MAQIQAGAVPTKYVKTWDKRRDEDRAHFASADKALPDSDD